MKSRDTNVKASVQKFDCRNPVLFALVGLPCLLLRNFHRSPLLNNRDLKQPRRRAEWTPTGSARANSKTTAHVRI